MGWTDAEIERCSKIKLGRTGGSFVRHPAERETKKTRQTLSRFSKQRRDRITLLFIFSQVTLLSPLQNTPFRSRRIKVVNMDFPLFDRFCVVLWIARA